MLVHVIYFLVGAGFGGVICLMLYAYADKHHPIPMCFKSYCPDRRPQPYQGR